MSETRTLWQAAGRQAQQEQGSTLLGRIAIIRSEELQQRSRQDLIRRRLILDQARHRWLLAVKRQPATQAQGSVLERAREDTQHTGPLSPLEPGFLWGLRRIGTAGHQGDDTGHPFGAVPICRHHCWEIRAAGPSLRCTRCGLTTHGAG